MATKPKKTAILSRDQFLAPSVKTEEYVIPELGGAVVLRPLTRQDQLDIMRESKVDGKTDQALNECLQIVRAFVEPALTMEDAGALRQHKAGIIDRLLMRINELSGFGRASIEAAKANFRS